LIHLITIRVTNTSVNPARSIGPALSIHPLGRREGGDLVGQRVEMHRAVAEPDPAGIVAPSKGVLEPVLVVALGVILARVRPAALGAVKRGMQYHRRLADQIVELERLDEIGVPDSRTVGDGEVVEGPRDLGHLAQPLLEHVCGAEDGAMLLHRPLHRAADGTGLTAALRMTYPVEPRNRGFRSSGRHGAVRCAGLDDLGGAFGRGAAEDGRSSSELVPSRVAPCTETQAASPTAIRPGTVCTGRSPSRTRPSSSRLHESQAIGFLGAPHR